MLESMIENNTATRAEINDVATKNGINCDLNEKENLKGPGTCYDTNDCRGQRTCS